MSDRDKTWQIGTKHAALTAFSNNPLEDFAINSANRGYDLSDKKFSCEYNQVCPKRNKNIKLVENTEVFLLQISVWFNEISCTSIAIRLHILRDFYQRHRWMTSSKQDITFCHLSQLYGYVGKGDFLEPDLQNQNICQILATVENSLVIL